MASNWYIGVDIGGTKIGVSRFDVSTSSIVEVERFPTGIQCDPVDAINRVVGIAGAWIENAGSSPEAIGVSVGGMYDVHSGCMRHAPHLPLWDGFPIVSSLSEALDAPVFGENDANACALAEWRFGAGRGCDDLIFLTFGTGLGAGLILDGKLHRGKTGLAGEVGAIRVSETGPPVRGKPGCLEGFASGAGIAMLAKDRQSANPSPLLPQEPSAKDVAEAARQGDALSLSILEECSHKLGQGLAILIDLLNPERIILGSIFTRCESLLRASIEDSISKEAMPETCKACEIVPAELGESIGDYGAATVAALGIENTLRKTS
ncbi:MAG: ROK family protein [Opitutaceae bacterium]|nr:ROK family protein [Opitutaceae bacterium]